MAPQTQPEEVFVDTAVSDIMETAGDTQKMWLAVKLYVERATLRWLRWIDQLDKLELEQMSDVKIHTELLDIVGIDATKPKGQRIRHQVMRTVRGEVKLPPGKSSSNWLMDSVLLHFYLP